MAENHHDDDDLNTGSDIDYDDEDLEGTSTTSAPSGHPRKISAKTEEQYLGYVKTLRRKLLREHDDAHTRDVLPIDLVDYLITRAPTLRPKTFINYRCGILYWLGTLPESSDVHHARLVLQVGIPKTGFKGPKGRDKSTLYSRSSSRSRTFARRKFDTLLAELNRRAMPTGDRRQSRRASELMLWLLSGLATGLRPVEWAKARWHNQAKGQLLVTTAKRKLDTYALPSLAGMKPDPEDKLRIVNVDPDDMLWVEQHMANVRAHLLRGEPFKRFYDNCRTYLWAICRDLFGREERPPFTLYLMRGQFSANRKKGGQPPRDLAAEMGCDIKVAQTCYGKKAYGHGAAVKDKSGMKQADRQVEVAKKTTFSFARRAEVAGEP